jgi:hypothetical protein
VGCALGAIREVERVEALLVRTTADGFALRDKIEVFVDGSITGVPRIPMSGKISELPTSA